MPGRVVLLHGTSSSGKTTIARALQSLSDEPWVRLGIDAFWNAVDERWMEHGPRAAEGFAWMEKARIVPGQSGNGSLRACEQLWLPVLAPATTCSSTMSSSTQPGSMDGAVSSLASSGSSSECWHLSTCSRNARPPEATEWPARHAFSSISRRDRVRRHRGYGTSVARGVRPRDPVGASALIRVQTTLLITGTPRAQTRPR